MGGKGTSRGLSECLLMTKADIGRRIWKFVVRADIETAKPSLNLRFSRYLRSVFYIRASLEPNPHARVFLQYGGISLRLISCDFCQGKARLICARVSHIGGSAELSSYSCGSCGRLTWDEVAAPLSRPVRGLPLLLPAVSEPR